MPLRLLPDPDHPPALDRCYALASPGKGLGPLDPAPRILLLYGSLREHAPWSEGQVWCSPERHGQVTGLMKAQIDHLPLRASAGCGRPRGARSR